MEQEVLSVWLASVVSLFQSVLDAILAFPILRFLLIVLLFMVVIGLASWLTRRGRRGRL